MEKFGKLKIKINGCSYGENLCKNNTDEMETTAKNNTRPNTRQETLENRIHLGGHWESFNNFHLDLPTKT